METSSGGTPSNATLSGDTPPNCYTNGNLLRISPWVKYKDKYFLACQACGLPMFPASLKAPLLTDPVYDKYKNPFATNKLTPTSKDDLLKFAGKTQCDHDAPMAMMYNGLNKTAESFPNIGIGSNFCPLHPSCNTKKTNISPAEFWDWNKGTGDTNYKWNNKWTVEPTKYGEAAKFPDGPWGNTKDDIDKWCEKNRWDPRYYAQLTQWKYFSALEELVKDDSDQFGEKLRSAIKQASDLYGNMAKIKEEIKRVVNLLRQAKEPINLKNIIVTLDVAKAANLLTLIEPTAQTTAAEEAAAGERSLLVDVAAASEQAAVTAAHIEGYNQAHAVFTERLQHALAARGYTPRSADVIIRDVAGPRGGMGTRRNKKKRTKQTKKKIIKKKPQKTKRKNKKKKSKRTIKK